MVLRMSTQDSHLVADHQQDIIGLPSSEKSRKLPPGRICEMADGKRIRKGQTGIYLSVADKNLLLSISDARGLTMSMTVATALREYAYNHRDELRYYGLLMGEQKGKF